MVGQHPENHENFIFYNTNSNLQILGHFAIFHSCTRIDQRDHVKLQKTSEFLHF